MRTEVKTLVSVLGLEVELKLSTIAVAANFSAALYSVHEFVRLVCEESMLKADF
jgi:hypothetical protein